jgi:hypothetical protein
MREKITSWVLSNKKLIIVTFEIFWILIFLLDRVTSTNSAGPQFIYVNL